MEVGIEVGIIAVCVRINQGSSVWSLAISVSPHLRLPALILFFPSLAAAQGPQPTLQLRLIRNFGYGGFGKIQGRFTLKVENPQVTLEKIDFLLDEEVIFTALEEPF